jgi:glutamine synthetase
MDGNCNLYLAVLGIIAAGLHGLEETKELPSRSCDTYVGGLSGEERESLGVCTPMPSSLENSLECLRKFGSSIDAHVGLKLLDLHHRVKLGEIKQLSSVSEVAIRSPTLTEY